MGLPILSNEPGRHVKLGVYNVKYREFNTYENRYSTDVTWPVVRVEQTSDRSHTVKTGWDTTHGFPFRQPTTFSRVLEKYTYKDGIKNDSYVNHGGTTYLTELSGFRNSFNPNDLYNEVFANHVGIIDTDEHRKAVTECILKLNSEGVNHAQFIAEAKKSADLLTDTGITLLELLHSVKRGNFGSIPKNFGLIRRGVGNYWLQWQYGWKPLAADLYGMYQRLYEAPKKPLLHAKRQVAGKKDFSFVVNSDTVDLKGKILDTCELWCTVTDEVVSGAQNIGVINPLSLTWELIPYSFVVDWFCPIGNYLQALTAKAGLAFVGGYHSQSHNGTYTIHGEVGECQKEVSSFYRVAYNGFPSGQIYAEAQPFTPTRLASLTALLNKLF
jgi:hypothetical protein